MVNKYISNRTYELYKDIKIFDIHNSNCNIKNTNEEVLELISNNQIPIVDRIYNFDTNKLFKSYEFQVLGYVKSVDKVVNGIFYGTVVIFDRQDFVGEFVNYCIDGENVDDGFCMTKINSIQII